MYKLRKGNSFFLYFFCYLTYYVFIFSAMHDIWKLWDIWKRQTLRSYHYDLLPECFLQGILEKGYFLCLVKMLFNISRASNLVTFVSEKHVEALNFGKHWLLEICIKWYCFLPKSFLWAVLPINVFCLARWL